MKPKKHLGQNFLINETVAERVVEAGEVDRHDVVLEIGGGTGAVSKVIAEQVKRLITVELDTDLIPHLKQKLKDFKNVEIIRGDGLKILGKPDPKVNKVISSIPFQITSPLLHKLVKVREQISLSALLIQKEVAKRVVANPPNANYLSNFLQTFFEIEIADYVDKEAFYPKPEVDGAIVVLTAINRKEAQGVDPDKFSKFLHHGFMQRRKMLNKRYDAALLKEVGINPTRRAETLSVEEWVEIFRRLG